MSPKHRILSESLWTESNGNRSDALLCLCREIGMMLVDPRQFVGNRTDDNCMGESVINDEDKVQLYASKVLSMGLFFTEFCDAIREGDGSFVVGGTSYSFL